MKMENMAKKILLINGHPNKESFNYSLAESYKFGATDSGAHVKELVVADLKFDPNLQFGYQKRMELEPDLVQAVELIKWADHLVWVHPVWWGGLPALTKGFIDRVFLPGITFKNIENSVWWEKLLKGKTAHIITTLDQPGWYYWLMYGRPSVNQLKKATLEFCGVKPVKVTYIGIVKGSDVNKRDKWKAQVFSLGKGLK